MWSRISTLDNDVRYEFQIMPQDLNLVRKWLIIYVMSMPPSNQWICKDNTGGSQLTMIDDPPLLSVEFTVSLSLWKTAN